MPTLTPVDGDPFAASSAAPTPAPTPTAPATVAAGAPRLVPVDHNPFAKAAAPIPTMTVTPSRPPVPVQAQSGDVPSQQAQPTGNFFAGARGPPPALAPTVQNAAAKYGVPLAVANWVGWHESGWRSDAVGQQTSTGTAKGAWQFKDGTAKEMGLADPHDFTTSTDAAMRYLRKLADKNGGDWNKAVEAYGTFSTGMGAHRDAAAKAGFQQFLGNTGATRPASDASRYDGWDQPGSPTAFEDEADPEWVPFRDPPGTERGSVLPIKHDKDGYSLAVPDMLRAPVRGVIEGGQEARGIRPVDDPRARGDITSALGFKASPTERMFAPTGAARVAADAAAQTAATDRAALGTANKILGYGRTPEGKAAAIVGKRANQDIRGGGYYEPEVNYGVPPPATGPGSMPPLALSTGPADEVVGNLDRMRESGKPANVVHVLGPNVEGLAGKLTRQPGDAKAIVRGSLKGIDAGAQARNEADVGNLLTKGSSSFRTTVDLLQARSVEGKPLYEKAFEGGSMAPLRAQFEQSLGRAQRAESVADAALKQAMHEERVLREYRPDYQQTPDILAAAAKTRAARARLEHARLDTAEVRSMAERAQHDIDNGTPGAVWNPAIQRLLDRPDVKRGLRLGYKIQADEAAAEGTRFNPSEYAMTPDGNVISVPNMRTLNVAKKGLDRIYSDTLDEFGRPTEAGRAIDMMRRSLLREMDAINPDYKVARAAWAEKSASLDAVRWAKGLDKISPEQVAQEFSDMSPGEQEFARLSVADRLLTKIGDTAFGADEAKNLLKNPNMRDRLQPIFRTQDEFVRYVQAVADERRMYDVNTKLVKNSETADRRAEDTHQDLSAGAHLAHGVANLAHGRMFRALGSGLRAGRDFLQRPNPSVDEAIARTLMNPEGGPQVVNGKLDFTPPAPPIPAPRGPISPRQ